MEQKNIIALRMARQHLLRNANEEEYMALYRDMQPGQSVYWNGFGDPPSLTFRAAFNDITFNGLRQNRHGIVKGRFAGGNIGWIVPEDLELFIAAYRKPLDGLTVRQETLLTLIEREGPLNIQQMKEETGLLVKEITPALHRLQEAFLIYEDQYDGEWDRGWYKFPDMFPEADFAKYTRCDALQILLRRFAYRHVQFDAAMAKSFYKLPGKDIAAALSALVQEGVLTATDNEYTLQADLPLLQADAAHVPPTVFAMHRNDFLVKSNEHWLKETFKHPEHDTLQYLLIDGVFHGAIVGHFRNGPYDLEDVVLDLPEGEAGARKAEILDAVKAVNYGKYVKRYKGESL